jgi:hypothetical protein
VCLSSAGRREIAAAAVTHLLAWLGWLRSNELFSLTWGDARITRPGDGPSRGLPFGIGAIELRLLKETKSNRTKVADVVIAYASASGLVLGLWLERLRFHTRDTGVEARLIRGSSGLPWTSRYFRTQHLYVWLHQLRNEGDVFLQAFTNSPGNRIEDKYYSMGSYRRGGGAARALSGLMELNRRPRPRCTNMDVGRPSCPRRTCPPATTSSPWRTASASRCCACDLFC